MFEHPSPPDPRDEGLLDEGRFLRIRSCPNARELGGYDTPQGRTAYHRFLRAGGTRALTSEDLQRLRQWGVTRVMDLRSVGESPRVTCRLSNQDWVAWENVPFYDYDLSAPTMAPVHPSDNYLVTGYLHMLSSATSIRRILAFFAASRPTDCILFHCAAGIDRTGVVAMLLLGLVGVARRQVIADYAYSFGSVAEVESLVSGATGTPPARISSMLRIRLDTIATVYDTVIHEHGTFRAFLTSCGVDEPTLDGVTAHLIG